MPPNANTHDSRFDPNASAIGQRFAAAATDHEAGRFESALEGYSKILEHDGEHVATLVHVAVLYLRYGRGDDARLVLASVLAQGEDVLLQNIAGLPEAYVALADLCLYSDNPGLADRILHAVSTFWPESVGLQVAIGIRLVEAGNWKGAEAQFLRVIEMAPDQPEAWIDLANIRLAREDYVGAMDAFVEALEIEPTNEGAARQALSTTDMLEDSSLVVRYLIDLTELIDDDVHSLVFIGLKLLAERNHRGALSAFARATDIEPSSFDAAIGAGAAAYHLDEMAAAQTYWSQSFEALPDDLEACLELIRNFAADIPAELVEVLLKHAARLVLDDADRLCLVGQAARDIGSEPAAVKLFRRAVALEPDNAFARSLLEPEQA